MTGYFFRTCPFVLTIAVMLCLPVRVLSQNGTMVPPGHTAANRATRQAENVEPPAPPVQNVTAAQVLQQADDLLSLAQQVHADTERRLRAPRKRPQGQKRIESSRSNYGRN